MINRTLIVATPRSWGTILQDQIRLKNLGCLSFGQPYHDFVTDGPLPYNEFISGIDAISKFLGSIHGIPFVCKLEPYHIYHVDSFQFVPLEKFNLKIYSKIYVLDRLDQRKRLASLLWAQESNKWHYFKNEENVTLQPKVIIRDQDSLGGHALECVILNKFCNQLDTAGLAYERIYAENLDQWFDKNNFTNEIVSKTRHSNLDYEKLILNLDQLYSMYHKFL
jgi:hypothetical protein